MIYTSTGLRERHILYQWQIGKTELSHLPSDANILANLPGVKIFFPKHYEDKGDNVVISLVDSKAFHKNKILSLVIK